MKYKKILYTSFVLILLSLNVFSQKDTTICFEINSTKNQTIKKNVLGLDVCFHIYNRIPMLGISYERIINKNNTISLSTGSNIYLPNNYSVSMGYHDDNITYGKFEYRFYFSGTGISKTTFFNDDFYLQKKKKALLIPDGLYIGLVAIYKNYHTISFTSNNEKVIQKITNSYHIGGSLGYQFALFNKVQTNISLPLALGYQRVKEINNNETYIKDYPNFSFFIDINFGIAF